MLDSFVMIFSTNKSLNIIYGVSRIDSSLILSGFTDKSFFTVETYNGWGDSVTHIIKDNINLSIFVNTNTWVCCTQINTDNRAFNASSLFSNSYCE